MGSRKYPYLPYGSLLEILWGRGTSKAKILKEIMKLNEISRDWGDPQSIIHFSSLNSHIIFHILSGGGGEGGNEIGWDTPTKN